MITHYKIVIDYKLQEDDLLEFCYGYRLQEGDIFFFSCCTLQEGHLGLFIVAVCKKVGSCFFFWL